MSSGTAPQLPESGWKVRHEPAFSAWLDSFGSDLPPTAAVAAVTDWIKACKLAGPPSDAVQADDDRYVAQVQGTRVFVTYLIVEYEFLIIVKEFR